MRTDWVLCWDGREVRERIYTLSPVLGLKTVILRASVGMDVLIVFVRIVESRTANSRVDIREQKHPAIWID